MTLLRQCLLGDRRDLIDQLLDRWSLSLLTVLQDGPRRFNELRRDVTGITQKSLSQTLRRLERNGMVDRRVLDTRPLAVEYRLTELGRSVEEPLEALARWATDHLDDVQRARTRHDG